MKIFTIACVRGEPKEKLTDRYRCVGEGSFPVVPWSSNPKQAKGEEPETTDK